MLWHMSRPLPTTLLSLGWSSILVHGLFGSHQGLQVRCQLAEVNDTGSYLGTVACNSINNSESQIQLTLVRSPN
jgi:hypothetical protein